jgi:hypothetical protein
LMVILRSNAFSSMDGTPGTATDKGIVAIPSHA